MSKVGGEGALNFRAGLDIEPAKKNAEELKKILKDLKIQADGLGVTPKPTQFDPKPLSEYQAGILKIKQEALELQKADKSASLATQAALKQERLEREAILTQIQKNKLALQEQQALERSSKTTTAKGGKRVTEISNSQAEIDAYNRAASASTIYTSAINAQVVARARDTQQAAAQAVAEGTLRTQQVQSTAAVVQSTTANKSNILTKIQAAKLLAEEKYIQAQATRELKNNIREQLNAKGSLEQRRAALIRLQIAYDRLSASERASASGQRLGGIVSRVTEQVKGLEGATGRAQRNVGNYTNAMMKGFSAVYSKIRLVANILPGLGLSGVILLALSPLAMLIEKLDIFKSSLDKLKEPQKALNTSYQEAAGLIAKEGAETVLLVSKIKDQSKSVSERQDLLNDFINKNPAVLGALNLQNIATKEGTAIINDYIAALKRKIEMQSLEKGYAEALEKKADIDSGKEDASIGWLGKTLITANKVLAGFKGETIGEAIDKANARFKVQALDAQNAIIKSYEDRIKTTVEGEAKIAQVQDTSLAAAEQRLSKVNERLRTLQKGESDKSLKQQKAQLEKEIKERTKLLGLDTNTSTGKAEAKAQESALKRQRVLQAEIDNVKKKGLASQEEIDEQEIKNIEIKYDTLRKKAIAFNSAKDSKGLKVSLSGIATAEETEKKEVTDKSSAKTLKDTLDIQARYYSEYEDLKTRIGVDKAKERYATLINTDKTYLDKLKEEQAKYADNPFAMKLLNEQIAATTLAIQKADDERYATAMQAAMTHAQALAAIDREYWANRKALGDNATDEQIANLDRQRSEAIRSANETNAYLKGGYDDLLQNYDKMTRQQVRDRLKAIKDGYRKEYEAGRLTAEQLSKLIGDIDNSLAQLDGNNSFTKISNALKKYREQVQLFGKDSNAAKDAQLEMFDAIAQGADDAGAVIGELANSFEQLGIGGEDLQKTLKNVQGIVSGAGSIAKGLATGNPVDVVTGSIKLLTSAIDLFNTKDKKLQKQINEYKDQLDNLGRAYAQLDRAVNNSVGESFYTDSQKQIDNLLAQQRLLIQMRDAEAKKKKSDKGKIQEYGDAIADIPNQIADINKAISENLIQTNFKELSQNLADALAEAFASGEDSAKGFDDVFRNVIANAVKNSLKLKILDPIIKKFTDDLTKYAQSNGNSVLGFDFGAYKDELKKAGDLFTAGLKGSEEYFKQIGLDDAADTGSNNNSLTGSIKNITEETGTVIAGAMNGVLVGVNQSNSLLTEGNKVRFDAFNIAKANLEVQMQIQQNTLRTANNTDALADMKASLASMDRKIGSGAAAKTANGLGT